jgi:hypothetical protein
MYGALFISALLGWQGAVAAQPGAVAARQPDASDWRPVVVASVYQPDGAVSMETTTVSTTSPSVVYVFSRKTMCDTTSAGGAKPANGGFGWRVATQVASGPAGATVVSVDWQRVWDDGKPSSVPSGNVQLTLHPGDRIPLDHIPNAHPTDACRAVGLGLDIRLSRTAATAPTGSELLPLGATEGGSKPVTADLWLVHKLPAGTDQTMHQTVTVQSTGGQFGFVPIRIATAQGDVSVEVQGAFKRYRAPNGTEFVELQLTRLIGMPGARPAVTETSGRSLFPLPEPAAVLAFEMPLAGGGGSGARGRVGSASGGGGGIGGAGATGGGTAAGGAVARSAGGGGGGRGGMAPAAPQGAALLLAGHTFAVNVRLTPN